MKGPGMLTLGVVPGGLPAPETSESEAWLDHLSRLSGDRSPLTNDRTNMDQTKKGQAPTRGEATEQAREDFKREFGEAGAATRVADHVELALAEWQNMPRSREASIVRTKLEEAQLWLGHLAEAGVE